MKKLYIIIGSTLVLAALLLAPRVFASSGLFDKYCSLKNLGTGTRGMICDLNKRVAVVEQQLAAIQLIPGPKGDQGQQGPKGDIGLQGQQGLSGKDSLSLDVFDINGNRLGKFVAEEDNSYLIQLESINRQILLDIDNGTFAGGLASVFFDQSNCGGSVFIQETQGKLLTRVHVNNPTHFFVVTDDGLSLQNIFALSGESHGNGDCTVAGTSGLNVNVHKAQQIQLPFSIPVPGPLILKEE